MHNELCLSQLQVTVPVTVTIYKLQVVSKCENLYKKYMNESWNCWHIHSHITRPHFTPLHSTHCLYYTQSSIGQQCATCAFKFDKITYTPGFPCCYTHTKWVRAENLHKMLSARANMWTCVCVDVCIWGSLLLVWHQTVSACQNRHVVHVSFPVAWLEMRAAAKSVCNVISQCLYRLLPLSMFSLIPSTVATPHLFSSSLIVWWKTK